MRIYSDAFKKKQKLDQYIKKNQKKFVIIIDQSHYYQHLQNYMKNFEFQTKNNITCFGYICNHPHSQENHTQKYINIGLNQGIMTYR